MSTAVDIKCSAHRDVPRFLAAVLLLHRCRHHTTHSSTRVEYPSLFRFFTPQLEDEKEEEEEEEKEEVPLLLLPHTQAAACRSSLSFTARNRFDNREKSTFSFSWALRSSAIDCFSVATVDVSSTTIWDVNKGRKSVYLHRTLQLGQHASLFFPASSHFWMHRSPNKCPHGKLTTRWSPALPHGCMHTIHSVRHASKEEEEEEEEEEEARCAEESSASAAVSNSSSKSSELLLLLSAAAAAV
jgi:hypothetical protein